MVGFGISNRQTFDAACEYASGGIIGSRFASLAVPPFMSHGRLRFAPATCLPHAT